MKLIAVKDKSTVLEEKGTANSATVIQRVGKGAMLQYTFDIELPKNAVVEARLVVGKREQVSPEYIP